VFLHGATVNFQVNFGAFGWVRYFNDRGFQVIGLDLRAHGKSGKPHQASAYGVANLAADVVTVVDHLGLEQVDLVGYSLGTAVALHLLKECPQRVAKAALVATGDGLLGLGPHTFELLLPSMLSVLERTSYPKDLPKHIAMYWNFIEATSGDRAALKALAMADYPAVPPSAASAITTPTLVISGENDAVLGQGPQLAKALCRGSYQLIPGADHFSLAMDPRVQPAAAEFLSASD
jgi:pimeloyl-ACP methyl ester carboxylesterase